MPPTRDELVADLVSRALEIQDESGTRPPVAELCSEHPELSEDVEDALGFAVRLPAMQGGGVARDPYIGTDLAGRYRIRGRLGSGAMGVVYVALDQELGRQVAIKVLSTALVEAGQARARFEREAEALAAIGHPAVVTIYDRGVTKDDAPYLVMEHIEGVSLSTVVEHLQDLGEDGEATAWISERFGLESLPEPSLVRQAARWLGTLAGGLQAAHESGVIHRDVKPSNVMIRRDGRAVLLDFGIAAVEDDSTLTRSDAAIGTPAYMAPEALGGSSKTSAAQDIYGLSATLYHLVTRHAPFEGSPTQVITALASREPRPANKVRPGLPRDLQAILDAGLARRPAHRYATASAMGADLQAFLAYRQVSVRPTSTLTRSWRRMRRSRMAAGAGIALLLGGTTWGIAGYLTAQAKKAQSNFEFSLDRVPANLGLVNPNNLVPDSLVDLGMVQIRLDMLVESGVQPAVSHNLRGAFRLDSGDTAGAAEDMLAVAWAVDSKFTAALAAAIGALPDGATARDLDFAALPEPVTAMDGYLGAYHAIRSDPKSLGPFIPMLSDPELADVRHAQELALLIEGVMIKRLNAPSQRAELRERAAQMREDVRELESRFGSRSAMSAHLLGMSNQYLQQREETVAVCLSGLELSPQSHVLLNNGARACLLMGRLDLGRELAARGLELCDDYPMFFDAAIRIECKDRNFDAARALHARATFENSTTRAVLAAIIEVDQSFDLRRKDQPEASSRMATQALEILRTASDSHPEVPGLRSIAAALAEDDQDAAFIALLQQHGDIGVSPQILDDLLAVYPKEPTPPAFDALYELLWSLRDALTENEQPSYTAGAERGPAPPATPR